jgi:hypothetical protein
MRERISLRHTGRFPNAYLENGLFARGCDTIRRYDLIGYEIKSIPSKNSSGAVKFEIYIRLPQRASCFAYADSSVIFFYGVRIRRVYNRATVRASPRDCRVLEKFRFTGACR